MAKSIVIDTMPAKTSKQEAWLTWYDLLIAKLPNKTAKAIWVKAWGLRGGKDSPAYSSDLRSKMEKHGINIDKTNTAAVIDTGKSVVGFFQDFAVAGKWTTIGLGIAIAGAVTLLLFNIARKPIESANAAANLTRAVGSKGMA